MEETMDILMVDDSPNDLLFFGRAASNTHLNIRLQTLTAGRQAIDYLTAKGEYNDRSKYPWPDLIVMDLKMPEVNGFDLLAWRQTSALLSCIPVIVLSGSSEPDDVKRIFELGANKHLVKPAALADWEKVVREVWDFWTEGTAFLKRKATAPGTSR
jgi:CheY-like chemotaxis protein